MPKPVTVEDLSCHIVLFERRPGSLICSLYAISPYSVEYIGILPNWRIWLPKWISRCILIKLKWDSLWITSILRSFSSSRSSDGLGVTWKGPHVGLSALVDVAASFLLHQAWPGCVWILETPRRYLSFGGIGPDNPPYKPWSHLYDYGIVPSYWSRQAPWHTRECYAQSSWKDKRVKLPYLSAQTSRKSDATPPSSPDVGTIGRQPSPGRLHPLI